jgi:hypothetical protein
MTAGQLRFAAGIAAGLGVTESYAKAFPKCKNPEKDSARLMSERNPEKAGITAEIQRLRMKAEDRAGGVVMDLIEKRTILAQIARGAEKDNDRIAAIRADNELGPDGSDNKLIITINRV